MRILFALPGLHKYDRGAEIAFVSIARELARTDDIVTLIGSGAHRQDEPYHFLRAASISREHFEAFPSLPTLRNETAYEDATFALTLLRKYRPAEFDVTVTCNYPFTNWALRRHMLGRPRPPHIFVTQNGDWPAQTRNSEYRFFGCEGLVCTNPDFLERNKKRWRCALIPNGVDSKRFFPAPEKRDLFNLPPDRYVVLMVSALIPSKRVTDGIRAIAAVSEAHLVVAGDGPLRREVEELADKLLPNRFSRLSLPAAQMPDLYRSADALLHMSKEESFGNIFLEAMASGLPIVAHDSARLRWIVGNNGLLCDTENLSSVRECLIQARNRTKASATSYAQAARAFDWSEIAQKYRSFMLDVVRDAKHQS